MKRPQASARLRGCGVGLLDVAMIVKDEEGALPRSLKSLEVLEPILGRVVIYDTGSTDRTVRLARQWGAVVVQGHWDDDFSRARNAGLAHVQSEWFLQLDADEIVMADVALLEAELRSLGGADSQAASLLMLFVDDENRIISTLESVRLGRSAEVRYRNRIHETLSPVGGGSSLRRSAISIDSLALTHFGYLDREAVARKGERNLRISLQEEEELQQADPARTVEALVNRGRSMQIVGDLAGAIDVFRAAWDVPDAPSVLRQWAGEQLVAHLLTAGRLGEAEGVLPGLAEIGTDQQHLDHVRAQIHLARGEHQQALEAIRRVDRPRQALGAEHSWVSALRIRALSAATVGQHDEAIAAIVSVLARHGMGGELIPLLLALWGQRPPEVLAQLLKSAGTQHVDAVCHDLAAHRGAGERVASAYRALV